MNPRIGFALVLGVLLASSVLRAASTPSKALLVLAKRDRTLAIVDPSTLKAVARIPVGPDPHEVIADSHGKFLRVQLRWRGLPYLGDGRPGRAEGIASSRPGSVR